jgi:hypothetical protein
LASANNNRQHQQSQACSLFVPTVKDSRICSVCRHLLHEHIDNNRLSTTTTTTSTINNHQHHHHPTRIRPIPYIYNHRSSDSGYRSGGAAGRKFDERFRRITAIDPRKSIPLNPSENSAFTQYKRTDGNAGSCDDHSLSSTTPASSVSISSSSGSDASPPPPIFTSLHSSKLCQKCLKWGVQFLRRRYG